MRRVSIFAFGITFSGSVLLSIPAAAQIETVVVTAKKLAEARNSIQTQVGASTYTVTHEQIEQQPGGENVQLNQIVLQTPGVSQDSFGQFHVREEHAEIQYRLNGIIIPEGIAVFGQTLNPRLADNVKLIDGALPAEYGLRTAGIIDIQTKTGLFEPGGNVSIYGGSHSEIQPSVTYGDSTGSLNYFVSGDWLTNTLGIESPDGNVDPAHDRTKQWHAFGYVSDILDGHSSVTGIVGTSNEQFQIPNSKGLEPAGLGGVVGLGPCGDGSAFFSPAPPPAPNCGTDAMGNPLTEVLVDHGQFAFPSALLNENQREITHFGILSYLRSDGSLDFQISVFGRYSSLFFTPDAVGDILFNGIAQTAYKRDVAYGLQAEGAYHLGDAHTVRAGVLYQADDLASRTSSDVFPLVSDSSGAPSNANCPPPPGNPDLACQQADAPESIIDNGSKHAWSYSLYLQDEWKVLDNLTVNYGIRWDQFGAFDSEGQLSPRINAVWKPWIDTTVHIGYSRYFTPPPIELVAAPDVALFDNTTAAAPQDTDATPKAERADYYDVGVIQNIDDGLVVGLDSFYKLSHNLIDEGQFGAPIILTPFNYAKGRQYGLELTLTYNNGPLGLYANGAYERAVGENIVSSQFNFSPDDLAYIATHFIPLDHQQLGTISAGGSYLFSWGTRISMDMLFGTGLRRDGATPNGDNVPAYATVNLGASHKFDLGSAGDITARFDVINLFDEAYEIRDGTGIGVGAPQWGARRGFFVGLSKSL
jgi:outer membrane receptor protein involved in Fe transport